MYPSRRQIFCKREEIIKHVAKNFCTVVYENKLETVKIAAWMNKI